MFIAQKRKMNRPATGPAKGRLKIGKERKRERETVKLTKLESKCVCMVGTSV